MKLGGQMDYHGSRPYASDLTSTERNWIKQRAAGLATWAKRKLELLLRPSAEQAAKTMWLVHGDERHFSLLGSSELGMNRRRADALCPFPEGEARIRRPIGYRSFSE